MCLFQLYLLEYAPASLISCAAGVGSATPTTALSPKISSSDGFCYLFYLFVKPKSQGCGGS